MTDTTSFSTSFTLDKAHYTECYTQSHSLEPDKHSYFKGCILTGFGLAILFTPVNPYAAWFVVSLGLLELVSIRYHKPWWVLRQLMSKASGSVVNLTIDEQGILIESFHINNRILWQDVTLIAETDLGFVINFTLGKTMMGKDIASKSYLSKAGFTPEIIEFVKGKNSA